MAEEPSTEVLTEKKGENGDGASGGVPWALYLDDAPWYYDPEIAFSLRMLIFQIRTGLSFRYGQVWRERNVGTYGHVWQIPFLLLSSRLSARKWRFLGNGWRNYIKYYLVFKRDNRHECFSCHVPEERILLVLSSFCYRLSPIFTTVHNDISLIIVLLMSSNIYMYFCPAAVSPNKPG